MHTRSNTQKYTRLHRKSADPAKSTYSMFALLSRACCFSTLHDMACITRAKATTRSISVRLSRSRMRLERESCRWSVTCSASREGRAVSRSGVDVECHTYFDVARANVDVVLAGISMRRDRTCGARRTRSTALHAAARMRGSDGDAERRHKDAASSWNSTDGHGPAAAPDQPSSRAAARERNE